MTDDTPSRKRQRDDDADPDGTVITLSARKKPDITLKQQDPGSLHDRLRSFLPQLANANAGINAADNLEDVDEDGPYIDMDLGLGVLEEESDSESSASEEESEEEDNVMQKLMGLVEEDQKAKIQEVTTGD